MWKSLAYNVHQQTNFDISKLSLTIDLNTRLWGITTEFAGFLPQSLVLRSIV